MPSRLCCRGRTIPVSEDDRQAIATRYRRFAEAEAHGISARYEELAIGIANSEAMLAFLTSLPNERQQPNLFLAAVRQAAGVARDVIQFEQFVANNQDDIRQIMLSRTTQTNEPARCAVLLPALAPFQQPLALLEVGASAGLCLYPDYYCYDYGRQIVPATNTTLIKPPVFRCTTNTETPLPNATPEICWRTGLDLNPLDVSSKEQMDWLETLVWPEQQERAERLQSAIAVVRHTPPKLYAGNLLDDLSSIATTAPADAQLVIFHTAVLSYVREPSQRAQFADLMEDLNAIWLSNEAPSVFPEQAQRAPPPPQKGSFLMSINAQPVAWTEPHGQYIHWFGDVPASATRS